MLFYLKVKNVKNVWHLWWTL